MRKFCMSIASLIFMACSLVSCNSIQAMEVENSNSALKLESEGSVETDNLKQLEKVVTVNEGEDIVREFWGENSEVTYISNAEEEEKNGAYSYRVSSYNAEKGGASEDVYSYVNYTTGKFSLGELRKTMATELVEYSANICNNTGNIIEHIYLVKGDDMKLLVSNFQPNSKEYVKWSYKEELPPEEYAYVHEFNKWDSPYFLLVVDGKKIPVTTGKACITNNYVDEQLFITSSWINSDYIMEESNIYNDEIAFFLEGSEYYYSPQSDYLDIRNGNDPVVTDVNYLYIPQLKRWLRQRENQVLFASSLESSEFEKYFPYYKGEIPEYMPTAVVTIEPVYLHDVYIQAPDDVYKNFSEVYNSDKKTLFTSDDVMVVSADNVRDYQLYFKAEEAEGKISRCYISVQERDSNNGGVVMQVINAMNTEIDFGE